jgi:hypothetical protein
MARQIARSWEGSTSRRLRKKIEMLFAHLKRILKLDGLRLRGPNGARDEFTLAATAQKSPQDGQADPDACPEACIESGKAARACAITTNDYQCFSTESVILD